MSVWCSHVGTEAAEASAQIVDGIGFLLVTKPDGLSQGLLLLISCLTPQQHASVSQGRIRQYCSRCPTEIRVVEQTQPGGCSRL